MKVQNTPNAAALAALTNPLIARHTADVLAILSDLITPLFTGKSAKQATLDLVHPVLNAMAEAWFKLMGWGTQGRISTITVGGNKDNGTVDFWLKLPNGQYLIIEVQFGNGGRLERDFAKLQKIHDCGLLALGFLVYFDRATSPSADSGLADYEKVVSRMDGLKDVPAIVIGVGRHGCESVDLREIPGIMFPSVLGGSGEGNKALHAFVAKAIIDRKPLASLRLTAQLKAVVRGQALAHQSKTLLALEDDVRRVLESDDAPLRAELLAMLAQVCKSSLITAAALGVPKKRVPLKRAVVLTQPAATSAHTLSAEAAHSGFAFDKTYGGMVVAVEPSSCDAEQASSLSPPLSSAVRGAPACEVVLFQPSPSPRPSAGLPWRAGAKLARAPRVEPVVAKVFCLQDYPMRRYHAPVHSAMSHAFAKARPALNGCCL